MRLVLVVLILVCYDQVMGQYIPRFDVQGHRGARGLRPENTIPAFLIALDSGVTTLEMDLCITKDGKVVVSHEPFMSADICLDEVCAEIKRTDEEQFNIFEMTYEQVLKFDCGSKGNDRFPEQIKSSQTKPLLRDVIIAAEDHIKSFTRYEVDYNLEIKSTPDGDWKFHPGVE